MSQSIHLFTIGLYLFDTLLSILVLKKKKQSRKQIKKYKLKNIPIRKIHRIHYRYKKYFSIVYCIRLNPFSKRLGRV